jgi:hypothetical protein
VRTIHFLAFCLPAAAMLIAGPARACDDRFPASCAPVPAVQTEDAQDSARAAAPRKSAGKASLRKRAAAGRKSARKSVAHASAAHASAARASYARASTARIGHRRAHRANAGTSVPVPSARPEQFDDLEEEPIKPRDAIAVASRPPAPREDLLSDTVRPAAMAVPDAAGVARAADETGTVERATEPIVVVSQAERNEIDLAAMEKPRPAQHNWLAQLLAALGAAFAAASVLRFLAA